MTELKFYGGSMGSQQAIVACDLRDSRAPVKVKYHVYGVWFDTCFSAADCRHTDAGLVRIGKQVLATEMGVLHHLFDCEVEKIQIKDGAK